MSSKPVLKIDWATHEAAKFACLNWHYSRSVPAGKLSRLGVWEEKRFIGVVLFGMGSGNATNGKRYGLNRTHEMAELARVALCKHNSPVSKIIAICIKYIKRQCPGLRLIISMADPLQGHIGGIYQAGNWIYTGETAKDYKYQLPDGRFVHHRTATSKGSVKGANKIPLPGKHRYLFPLDADIKKQILPLSKPYPKRDKQATASIQDDSGGAAPTVTLHKIQKEPIAGHGKS